MHPKIYLKCYYHLKDQCDKKTSINFHILFVLKEKFFFNFNFYFTSTHYSVYPKWEFSHITLPVKNLLELKSHFRDLLRPPIPNWLVQCKRILSQQHAPLCQHALKKGQTPKPLRGELWSYVLGSNNLVNVKSIETN